MKKPLAAWDATEIPAELVWMSRLDNRFKIEVLRTGDGSAQLMIWDHENDDKLLLDEEVGLMYGAKFGPDVDDVASWQGKAIELVDNLDS